MLTSLPNFPHKCCVPVTCVVCLHRHSSPACGGTMSVRPHKPKTSKNVNLPRTRIRKNHQHKLVFNALVGTHYRHSRNHLALSLHGEALFYQPFVSSFLPLDTDGKMCSQHGCCSLCYEECTGF